jgi:hypothetical protein
LSLTEPDSAGSVLYDQCHAATVLTRRIEFDLAPEQVFQNLHGVPGFFFLDSGWPATALQCSCREVSYHRGVGDGIGKLEAGSERRRRNPLTCSSLLRQYREEQPSIPFVSGGVGYMSYERDHRRREAQAG